LASGYHLVWDFKEPAGRRYRSELHAYPRSSGGILRILGGWLEREAELVVEKHLQEFLEFKAERSSEESLSHSSATFVAAE
jgi:hypothetical protein